MTLQSPYLEQSFSFPAPAKLNLFLHIVGQRPDGYHDLETLFQFIDYCDTLSLKVMSSPAITLTSQIEGVAQEDNLIYKAAKLLQESSGTAYGVEIDIEKQLPMGGGLGGGSSNAATVLVALNELWQCNFTTEQLAQLGLTLGADVPIFVHGFAAFAQGVGEKLTPAAPIEYYYVITKPHCSISTQVVFTNENLTRDTPKLDFDNNQINAFSGNLFEAPYKNDCQDVVINHYSEVAKLLAWLIEYAPSRMTGTGACIFSCCTSFDEAKALQKKLPESVTSVIAKGLNKSPLCFAVEKLRKNKPNFKTN